MTREPQAFPHLSWAWPQGALDLLLQAVIGPDEATALAAARQWFATEDIDAAGFAEHRLLMAVAARFGHALADLPAYPRLAGLQRMLWTKARMALREVQPPLALIAGAGIPVMVIKGAARLAVNPADQKSRISHDTDILVPPAHFAAALEILTAHRWQASTGESGLCLAARLARTRSVNLFYGHFGDIDLHQWGYGAAAPQAEADLWRSSVRGRYFDVPVLVPAPEHRIALALYSSALDAHAHSDWLVDCARVLMQEAVDPGRLHAVLGQGDLAVQAGVALSYLGDRIGLPVPGLAEVKAQARRAGRLHRLGVVLQMKPRSGWTPLSRLARGVAKQLRKTFGKGDRPFAAAGPLDLRGHLRGLRSGWQEQALTPALSPLALGPVPRGRHRVDLTLAVDLPGTRRRLEFELNQNTTHVARLRARSLLRRKGWHSLRFSGQITTGEDGQLWLEARPSKALRGADQAETDRYGPLQMRLLSATIRPLTP